MNTFCTKPMSWSQVTVISFGNNSICDAANGEQSYKGICIHTFNLNQTADPYKQYKKRQTDRLQKNIQHTETQN